MCDLEQSYILSILGGKQQRFYQANQDHIFSRSSLDLSSRFLSSQIPIQGVGPTFLDERRILMGI
jgi:hypothetical protein